MQKLYQTLLNELAAKFADQKTSGLTIRQWCEQNNVSFHKYNYWKHQLKEEVVDQMVPDIVQISVPSQTSLLGSPSSGKSHIGADVKDRTILYRPSLKLSIYTIPDLRPPAPRALIHHTISSEDRHADVQIPHVVAEINRTFLLEFIL